jgi:hypothetical protein
MFENELGQKKTTQKIPLTSINGGLNNKQLTLKGVVIKEKWELRSIKGTNKTYELKQLPTYDTQHLEYNLMGNNVESICNVYLQHHLIKVNI